MHDLPMPGAEAHNRRDLDNKGTRNISCHVVACDGARATLAINGREGDDTIAKRWTVGKLLSISVGENRVVAMAVSMQAVERKWNTHAANGWHIEVELLGEVTTDLLGNYHFASGISVYPYLGSIAHEIREADLRAIYNNADSMSCAIGKLSQHDGIDATVHVPTMLQKHFAVVGSTGVGKSTAVSMLLNKSIESNPKLRVLILDPHNEYASAFPSSCIIINSTTLDLPFWLMRLEEIAEVVFRGRPPVPEEMEVLRELIPEAKRMYRQDSLSSRRGTERAAYTADSPAPYRMTDLLSLIDERIGRLEGRDEKPMLRSLKLRLIAIAADPAFRFMFSSKSDSDSIMDTVAHILRIPGGDRPITALQLAGVSSDVVNCVASVLCRLAFETAMASNGGIHILVVCEEAHRYIPSDTSIGFAPTRYAIARIAREGRKYGVSLGIVTQRPSEVDATILSQCSTIFAMRLANDRDKDIIRNAIPDSSSSTVSFITSIANGEAIAFGEAVSIPMRMRFQRVQERFIPRSAGAASTTTETRPSDDPREIVERMRNLGGAAGRKTGGDTGRLDTTTDDDIAEFRSSLKDSPDNLELESYRPEMLPRRSLNNSPASPQVNDSYPPKANMHTPMANPRTEYASAFREMTLRRNAFDSER
jgi:uncharacterized protein